MATPEKPHVIDDPDAPPSEEELAASARLRDALDDAGAAHEGAELLRAAAYAHAPRDLPEGEHRALVERALATPKAQAPRAAASSGERRGRVIRVAFGVGGALALAAGLLLVVRGADRAPLAARTAPAELARPRSTQELFTEPFTREARASVRIDRIALARSSDLRENRFARWGVR